MPSKQTSQLSEEDLEKEVETRRQNAICSIVLELKLILDAPEHIWRCVEKGNTLKAAWIWIVARSVWWDIQAVGGSVEGADQVDEHRRLDIKVSRKCCYLD